MPAPADPTAAPKLPSDDAKALASIVERRYGKVPDAVGARGDHAPSWTDASRVDAGCATSVLRNDEEPDTLFRA